MPLITTVAITALLPNLLNKSGKILPSADGPHPIYHSLVTVLRLSSQLKPRRKVILEQHVVSKSHATRHIKHEMRLCGVDVPQASRQRSAFWK
ncbi:uncharacterized protein PHALS_05857 [Plasmopara halstedii]|uniref:Uncharacterized protein n=1 Tax=Plasmopara halstedii TaxID=4781 RepID=A0A0P1AC63_PLAHL|nr:uncharacterized protein PHALS_05857 [Plasmopara halstedii]CEG37802.1 hypothetical protein PHALS_05857 [Plasmopara halstedii]|eukprot:XP_024574171.1 hypothetical protein PHALS_05857 [Plasmopara halstedii]